MCHSEIYCSRRILMEVLTISDIIIIVLFLPRDFDPTYYCGHYLISIDRINPDIHHVTVFDTFHTTTAL